MTRIDASLLYQQIYQQYGSDSSRVQYEINLNTFLNNIETITPDEFLSVPAEGRHLFAGMLHRYLDKLAWEAKLHEVFPAITKIQETFARELIKDNKVIDRDMIIEKLYEIAGKQKVSSGSYDFKFPLTSKEGYRLIAEKGYQRIAPMGWQLETPVTTADIDQDLDHLNDLSQWIDDIETLCKRVLLERSYNQSLQSSLCNRCCIIC